MTTPTERLLDALRAYGKQPKRAGQGWQCSCPAHDDSRPSLSISEGSDGRALVFCFAGCTAEMVAKAVGLKLRDLMPDNGTAARTSRTSRPPAARVEPKPMVTQNGRS